MSTRATYEINGKCFYIHHDGYLKGGAEYFHKALTLVKDKFGYSTLEADFFRANEGAEFTDEHKSHGDTEFRYTVDGNKIEVEKRYWPQFAGDSTTWKNVYTGNLIDFVNEYSELDKI